MFSCSLCLQETRVSKVKSLYQGAQLKVCRLLLVQNIPLLFKKLKVVVALQEGGLVVERVGRWKLVILKRFK